MSDILYGVKLLKLRELDPTTQAVKAGGIVCSALTAQQASLDPVISNGDEKVLRDDDIILAIARTPDLTYGYDFKFTDAKFDVNIASLIEGGTIRKSGETVVGYDSPMLAAGATMKPFLAEVYVANYEGDSIINYVKITLNNCTGKAPKLEFKKDFFAPEFEIKAREATKAGKPVKSIDYVDILPTDDTEVPILTMISVTPITIGSPVIAKSSELGGLYFVNAGANISTVGELQNLVNVGMGAYASINVIDTNTNIDTTGLTAGNYKVYAVDGSGNISIAGATIVLS